MAVTCYWYGLAQAHAWGGITESETTYFIDFLTNTINCSLHTSSYAPDQDTHDFWDDCTNEAVFTGYTTHGVTLANKTLGYTAGTNTLKFDSDDASWTSSSGSAAYAVVYKLAGGAHSADPLMGYVNFGGTQTQSGSGTYKVAWASAGIFTIVVS